MQASSESEANEWVAILKWKLVRFFVVVVVVLIVPSPAAGSHDRTGKKENIIISDIIIIQINV